VIERALTRRMLESGSHDVEDDAQFDKRVKLMEELEAQQWADREKELNQIMVQKLDIVSKLLLDLKNKIANEHTMKLERAFEIEKKRNAKVLAAVKHDYLRGTRCLHYLAIAKLSAYLCLFLFVKICGSLRRSTSDRRNNSNETLLRNILILTPRSTPHWLGMDQTWINCLRFLRTSTRITTTSNVRSVYTTVMVHSLIK